MLISAMDQVIAGRWTHQIRFFPSSVSLWVSAQIKVGCGCRVQFPVRFWWGFWVVPGGSGCGMGFRGYRFFFWLKVDRVLMLRIRPGFIYLCKVH